MAASAPPVQSPDNEVKRPLIYCQLDPLLMALDETLTTKMALEKIADSNGSACEVDHV